MNYEQPWHQLDIDVSYAVRKDVDLPNMLANSQFANDPAAVWVWNNNTAHQIFNSQWMHDMHNQGIPVQSALIFYREPFYTHQTAHVDIRWGGSVSCAAINWTLDELDDSEMIWYQSTTLDHIQDKQDSLQEIPNVTSEQQPALTSAGYKVPSWPIETFKSHKVISKTIGAVPTLVRIGIPHNIVMRSRPRWAISVRCDDKHLQDWRATVDFFKPWIKNADC